MDRVFASSFQQPHQKLRPKDGSSADDAVRAAVEGRLPRGVGVERLRDAPRGVEPTV
jgi:hypothetical protein